MEKGRGSSERHRNTSHNVPLLRSVTVKGQGSPQPYGDLGKELLMSTVTRYFQAAIAAMILSSFSVAGDSPEIATTLSRAGESPSREGHVERELRGLELRRPYERDKVPVVFIHGLWGSPRNWDRMVEHLEADPTLRTRYQFWTFRYASGDSIPYSAYLLRQALRQARRDYDPDGTDASFDRMVVVGHSLGGILAKMMVQNSGSRLWQTVCARPIDLIEGPREECQLFQQAFFYKPVPEVRRVIFIATPHRGSPLASGRLGELGTQLCRRPNHLRQAREMLLAHNEPALFTHGFQSELPTSAGELAPGHRLLLGLIDLAIDSSVGAHSIIADFRDPPAPDGTDGIVPYSSSHLDGVVSELLVRGLHICLDHPAVIEEIRRILMEHAVNESSLVTDHHLSRDGMSATPPGPQYRVRRTADSLMGNLSSSLVEVQP
jgi:pimeloyl-ACP methyl ester carboxylesterase